MEPIIICPSCKTEIKLTESLAAPLLEATRRDYEQRLAQKETDIAQRESSLRDQQDALSKARASIDDDVAEKLTQERTKIAADEARKAKQALATDLEEKTREITDLQEVLKQREGKLAEAQQAQADVIRKQRELDDAKRELDLTVEKRVEEGLATTREQARKEAEEGLKLKVLEKEQTIASMQKQIEEQIARVMQATVGMYGDLQGIAGKTLQEIEGLGLPALE